MSEERIDLKGVLDFIVGHEDGFLATVENDKPHVRPMTVWLADDTGIYFYTSRVKQLFGQLEQNPEVEVVFVHPSKGDTAPGSMVRLAGRVEFVDDPEIRGRLWQLNPWLLDAVGTPEEAKSIVVLRISRGRFNYWTWENNVNPAPWVDFP